MHVQKSITSRFDKVLIENTSCNCTRVRVLGQLVCKNVCEISCLAWFWLRTSSWAVCAFDLFAPAPPSPQCVRFLTPALVVLCAPHASSCVKIRTTRGPYAVADLVHEGPRLVITLWRLRFLDLVLRKRRSSDGFTLPERGTSGVAPRNRSDAVGQSPHLLLERRTFVRETAHRGLPLVARRRFAGLPLSQARLVAWVARVAQNIFTVHVHRHTLSRSLFQRFSFQTDM